MKPKDIYRELRDRGWTFHRKGKGCHEIWRRGRRQITVSPRTLDRTPHALKNLMVQAK